MNAANVGPVDSAVARFGRWLGRFVAGSKRRAGVIVAVALLIAAASAQYARGIRVNTNLEALLADNSPSVMALAELRTRQGPTDLLNIAVRSEDPAANRRLVEDIHARVSTWPEVSDAFIELDYTPLRDHALYYLDTSELADLHQRLENERRRAVATAMSVTGSEIDPSKVLAGDDWDEDFDEDFDEEEESEPAESDSDAEGSPPQTVRELLEEQRRSVAKSGRIREADLELIWPRENERGEMVWEDRVQKPVAAPDGKIMLVRARLQHPPTNLEFSTQITTKVDALLEELDVETYAPDMLAKVGGAYASSGEAKSIIKDLRASTWLSAALVLAVLLIGFRSLRGLVIVLVPLISSVMVTVALARVLLGELNVLTAFLFAVLLGIGVDFAVHLYAQRERLGRIADWGEIFSHHLRPLGASMLTTMGSFLVLTLADFRGFQEFGLIAAVGVLVAFVAAVVMVPAFDVLLGSRRSHVPEATAESGDAMPKLRAPKIRIAILLAVGVVGLLGAPKVRFERDMRQLRAPKSSGEKGIAYQRALKATQDTGTPVVLLADSSEQLDAAVSILEAQQADDLLPGTERGWLKSVYSLATHMPADQADKVELLEKIADTAEGLRAAGGSQNEYATHLDVLERLARAKPLSEEELPAWAKQLFQERNGDVGKIGLLYTQVQGYDLGQVVYVTQRFAELMEAPGVRGASTRFILGDLTIAVEEDTQRLPPLALGVIALLIAFDLRRLWPVVITFTTLCLGLLLTFGVMGMWPIRINFYNLVVMPAVVGLGIDASIHLWHARKSSAVGATSKAALVSALTTAGGFSGLTISEHGGLRSIGLLGVTATLCCVLVAIVALGWPRIRGGPPA